MTECRCPACLPEGDPPDPRYSEQWRAECELRYIADLSPTARAEYLGRMSVARLAGLIDAVPRNQRARWADLHQAYRARAAA